MPASECGEDLRVSLSARGCQYRSTEEQQTPASRRPKERSRCLCCYAACNLLTHPSHQLLHLHVQRRRQGDERAQTRVHGGAGAGLALFELLVGVGGDAGGVGQGLLAEALGDAGALQPQAELAGDGPPLLVLAGGGGSAHDHQRRAVTNLAPPYMYGNLEMSAEMEGGERRGWRLTTRPM